MTTKVKELCSETYNLNRASRVTMFHRYFPISNNIQEMSKQKAAFPGSRIENVDDLNNPKTKLMNRSEEKLLIKNRRGRQSNTSGFLLIISIKPKKKTRTPKNIESRGASTENSSACSKRKTSAKYCDNKFFVWHTKMT